jgi:hypothetical protein
MSKHNNANWDHYKLAGRERPGHGVPHEDARRSFSGADSHADANAEGPHIPNQERASQPRSGGSAAAAQEQAPNEDPAEANAAPDDVAPRLTDDEGYTG